MGCPASAYIQYPFDRIRYWCAIDCRSPQYAGPENSTSSSELLGALCGGLYERVQDCFATYLQNASYFVSSTASTFASSLRTSCAGIKHSRPGRYPIIYRQVPRCAENLKLGQVQHVALLFKVPLPTLLQGAFVQHLRRSTHSERPQRTHGYEMVVHRRTPARGQAEAVQRSLPSGPAMRR
jgi:hypothetical protein